MPNKTPPIYELTKKIFGSVILFSKNLTERLAWHVKLCVCVHQLNIFNAIKRTQPTYKQRACKQFDCEPEPESEPKKNRTKKDDLRSS